MTNSIRAVTITLLVHRLLSDIFIKGLANKNEKLSTDKYTSQCCCLEISPELSMRSGKVFVTAHRYSQSGALNDRVRGIAYVLQIE